MGECVVCRETVTNPVCPSCLSAEIGAWLEETKPELLERFNEASKEMDLVLFNEETCILCKQGMDVCTYCYTEHIFNWLMREKSGKKLMREFLTYFNYDSGLRGYLFKAEKLGLLEE